MSTHSHTLPQFPLPPSINFVKDELRRIPRGVRIGLRKLSLAEDLEQELHLAYYEALRSTASNHDIKKSLHAAGERFRYREIVRRQQREVPEEFAGASYHAIVYGEVPNAPENDE